MPFNKKKNDNNKQKLTGRIYMYLMLGEIKQKNLKPTHIYLSKKQNSALNNSSHGFHFSHRSLSFLFFINVILITRPTFCSCALFLSHCLCENWLSFGYYSDLVIS